VKNHCCLISMLVTPAEAGVQLVYLIVLLDIRESHWIPACAGMTVVWDGSEFHGL